MQAVALRYAAALDPWILLTAAALATRGIRLGTAVTPVARRRPAKLAREVATLDRLTGGRDEGLHALNLRWSGEPVTYRGNQITIDDVVFLPAPVQRPRVPIWVRGVWPNKAPMRRAARWDGAIPAMAGMETARPPDLSEVRELVVFLRGCRAENGLADKPLDIVIGGMSPAGRQLAKTSPARWPTPGSRGGTSGCPGVMTCNVLSRSCAGSNKARPASSPEG